MTTDLISLDEAAALIPGANADTLRRYARAGLLTVYKIGRTYSTTRADVDELVKRRAIKRPAPAHVERERSLEMAAATLDAALAGLPHRKRRR